MHLLSVIQLFFFTFFFWGGLKHIIGFKWLVLPIGAIKCGLQGPTMSRKYQPMNLGHFISQIMQKASQPSYPNKVNLTKSFFIEILGFKTSSINQKLVTQSTSKSIQKTSIRFKRSQPCFTHGAKHSKNLKFGVEILVQGNLSSFPHSFS